MKKINILLVRPIISQIRALMSQDDCNVYCLSVWEKNQDPNLTKKLVDETTDINWISWYPQKNYVISFLSKVRKFHQLFHEKIIDIVHLNGLRDILAAYFARIFSNNKPRIIATSHNPSIWISQSRQIINTFFLQFFTDGVITISTINEKILIENGFKKDKICFIHNAFNNSNYITPKITTSEKSIVEIIYVASIEKRKAQITLIEAFNNVIKIYQNVKLKFIGPFDRDEQYYQLLINRVNELKFNDVIQFLGKLPHSEVLDLYQSADIVVFPSTAEMMPRAVIEAMWLGKPVIASSVDGILDLIEDKKTGLLCEPGDVYGFSEAINYLIENPIEAKKIGIAGKGYVHENCSLDAVGRKYFDFYIKILSLN